MGGKLSGFKVIDLVWLCNLVDWIRGKKDVVKRSGIWSSAWTWNKKKSLNKLALVSQSSIWTLFTSIIVGMISVRLSWRRINLWKSDQLMCLVSLYASEASLYSARIRSQFLFNRQRRHTRYLWACYRLIDCEYRHDLWLWRALLGNKGQCTSSRLSKIIINADQCSSAEIQ